MLDGNEVVVKLLGFFFGAKQQAIGRLAQVRLHVAVYLRLFLDGGANVRDDGFRETGLERVEHLGEDRVPGLFGVHQRRQEMFGVDALVIFLHREGLSVDDRFLSLHRELI